MEPLPKVLYKYQSFESKSLVNLEAHQIWFSTPNSFNDPFDCNFAVNLRTLTKEDRTVIIRKMAEEKIPGLDAVALTAPLLTDGEANSRAEERFKENWQSYPSSIEAVMNRFYTTFGVACFTTKKLDMLMWSHYADGHRGFCLEFDTSFRPFLGGGDCSGAIKVKYSKKYLFNLAGIFSEENSAAMEILTNKGCSFRREKEYRIIHVKGGQATPYDSQCLKAVYFGANMSFENRCKIASALKGSTTKFFEMRKSKERFMLTYEPLFLAF